MPDIARALYGHTSDLFLQQTMPVEGSELCFLSHQQVIGDWPSGVLKLPVKVLNFIPSCSKTLIPIVNINHFYRVFLQCTKQYDFTQIIFITVSWNALPKAHPENFMEEHGFLNPLHPNLYLSLGITEMLFLNYK